MNVRVSIVGALLGIAFRMLLSLPPVARMIDDSASGARELALQIIGWALFGSALPLLVRAARRFRVTRQSWPRNVPALAASVLAVTVPTNALAPLLMGYRYDVFVSMALGDQLTIKLIMAIGIVQMIHAAFSYSDLVERERHTAQLRTQLVDAELHLLRSQLNPHFLFNALTSVLSLATPRPEAAAKMLALIRSLLEASLRSDDRHLVRLREELELVQTYLAIEKVRFGSRLRLSFDVDVGTGDCYVPTLLLQPIVENAVRHGIGPLARGGTIRVSARRENGTLRLQVEDDGRGAPAVVAEHIGLTNARLRLRHCYGAEHALTIRPSPSGGTVAEITLPFREQAWSF